MVRSHSSTARLWILGLGGVLLLIGAMVWLPYIFPEQYEAVTVEGLGTDMPRTRLLPPSHTQHVETPESVKAIYMTSWIAGTPSLRKPRILDVIDTTEINSVVIDIKDDTGKVSFITDDPVIEDLGWSENRVSDMKELIEELHAKGVYVIGRIAVFQDPYMTQKRPDLAAKFSTDTTRVWQDKKGLSWMDPGAKEYWDLVTRLAFASYRIGFDEINFDYVRFPSDGNVSDIYYPFSSERLQASSFSMEKAHIIKEFWEYVHDHVKEGTDPLTGETFAGKISADIFGMTTTASDDMRIGQILEYALASFDYVAPMVYPSHFPSGYYGIPDVNAVPGRIISISMGEAVQRAEATTTDRAFVGSAPVASTTPQLYTKPVYDRHKLRPWLQDNDYPVHYTAEMVRAQIEAAYGVGLNSWMLWDAGNTYTKEALLEN